MEKTNDNIKMKPHVTTHEVFKSKWNPQEQLRAFVYESCGSVNDIWRSRWINLIILLNKPSSRLLITFLVVVLGLLISRHQYCPKNSHRNAALDSLNLTKLQTDLTENLHGQSDAVDQLMLILRKHMNKPTGLVTIVLGGGPSVGCEQAIDLIHQHYTNITTVMNDETSIINTTGDVSFLSLDVKFTSDETSDLIETIRSTSSLYDNNTVAFLFLHGDVLTLQELEHVSEFTVYEKFVQDKISRIKVYLVNQGISNVYTVSLKPLKPEHLVQYILKQGYNLEAYKSKLDMDSEFVKNGYVEISTFYTFKLVPWLTAISAFLFVPLTYKLI